jgi:uncharacterized protein (TIGR02186 family)
MRRLLACLLLALGMASAAQAQKVVADLSQSRISITTSFAGSHILVFGAVREDRFALREPFDIIVTVSGPVERTLVRKKERVAGIWVNTRSATISAAPTFYKVSTTAALHHILSEEADERYSITIPRAIRAVGLADDAPTGEPFTKALVRIREKDGTYTVDEGGVTMIGDVLFRADIELPSNIVEGNYFARIFVMRDGQVITSFTDLLGVQKVGLERWIYALAQEQAAIYGLLSLAIAIAAGWAASAAFNYLRKN